MNALNTDSDDKLSTKPSTLSAEALREQYLVRSDALLQLLGKPDIVVLDAQVELPSPRFDGDYRVQSGHDAWLAARIPGSRHADLVDALSVTHPSLSFMRPDPQALADGLSRLGVKNGSRVIVYDRTDGFWAARLWWMLRWIGIHAAVLDGGWRAWQALGFPQEQGAPPADAGVDSPTDLPQEVPLQVHLQRTMWADREDVEAVVAGREQQTLVCALSEAVFSGRAASRYARRGHIPTSINVPARALYDAEGRYLPTLELAQAFVGLARTKPVLLYCGGGISAAVDALALAIIGRDDVRIYDGSLQEWTADPALPMETLP